MNLLELRQLIEQEQLMDTVTAAAFIGLKPNTLRHPTGRFIQKGIQIGQYWFWQKKELIAMSASTQEFIFESDDGRVIEASRFGRQWSWTNDKGQFCETNEEGNGLWLNGGQELGTVQFRVPFKPENAVKRILTGGNITITEIT